MGWNSWICFGASVTEDEVLANADFMKRNLLDCGWEYIVMDAGWYAPGMVALEDYEAARPEQLIDRFGRLVPDPQKFPSAAGGKGLKPLSDQLHAMGLKLGLHIMRGIPVQAYEADSRIKGTRLSVRDIADTLNCCQWYHGMYGIDMTKPGAAEYYESLFSQYRSWGVDYVKADDLLSPSYAVGDIEAISRAAHRNGIVLSLSPGPAPIEQAGHLASVCELWRISEDFWDNWESLRKQFPLCARWQDHTGDGHWADADMLPVGPMARRAMRGEPRNSNFTEDEQRTMMSLWAMFRSPLMVGCNLPEADPFTISLLTNPDIIEIDSNSRDNRQVCDRDGIVIWSARNADDESTCYLAVFNTNDTPEAWPLPGFRDEIPDSIAGAGITDIWTGKPVNPGLGPVELRPHAVLHLKLTKK